jgi:fructoselysine-6-P-deglycase FrlB-like protein
MLALRLLMADENELAALDAVPDAVERALTYDLAPLLRYKRIVFLGRGWCHGIARSAALTMQETSLVPAESYQTLDYRHGPIACADADTLVWCFDAPDDPASAGVLQDVRRTGAGVRCTPDDPLAALAQAQLFAVARAESAGVNPDAPRYLTRAIVLPES